METQTTPSNFVLVCNKIDSTQQEQMNRVDLPNFNCTVADLATTIGQQLSLDKDAFDIISFGHVLGNDKTLESYGINKGIIVYLMKKKDVIFKEPHPPQQQEAEAPYTTQVQEGCVAVKSALINAQFRKVLDGLADIEKRENLMAINPELRNDPTLFGILTDDTLMNTFIRPQNIMKVLKKYPNFLEVATHVAATFHEESSSSNPFNLDNLSRGALLNYSLDYPSDDEMDDSETSSVDSTSTQASGSGGGGGGGGGGGRLVGHPTQGFQNLLNAAHQFQQQVQRRNVPPSAAATQQPSRQPPAIITPEMLSLALSSATSLTSNATSSPAAAVVQQPPQQQQTGQAAPAAPGPVSQPPSSSASRIIGWAPQLRQMRELGITDDIVAIQALEATNGDVQAAINIIFS